MRIVFERSELKENLEACQREAKASFGDDRYERRAQIGDRPTGLQAEANISDLLHSAFLSDGMYLYRWLFICCPFSHSVFYWNVTSFVQDISNFR